MQAARQKHLSFITPLILNLLFIYLILVELTNHLLLPKAFTTPHKELQDSTWGHGPYFKNLWGNSWAEYGATTKRSQSKNAAFCYK